MFYIKDQFVSYFVLTFLNLVSYVNLTNASATVLSGSKKYIYEMAIVFKHSSWILKELKCQWISYSTTTEFRRM